MLKQQLPGNCGSTQYFNHKFNCITNCFPPRPKFSKLNLRNRTIFKCPNFYKTEQELHIHAYTNMHFNSLKHFSKRSTTHSVYTPHIPNHLKIYAQNQFQYGETQALSLRALSIWRNTSVVSPCSFNMEKHKRCLSVLFQYGETQALSLRALSIWRNTSVVSPCSSAFLL